MLMNLNNKRNDLTRGAMILALAVIVQQLRILIPMPSLIWGLIIGPLINSLMLLSTRYVKSVYIVICIASLLPLIAYFQGHLAFIGLVPVVLIGNLIYVFWGMKSWDSPLVFLGTIFKAFFMMIGAYAVFFVMGMINPVIIKMIFIMMGMLQIFAGVMGVLIAKYLYKRLVSIRTKNLT